MGYKNEFASLNKFSNIKEYYEKNIKDELIKIVIKTKKKEKDQKETPIKFLYTPKSNIQAPCVAFDGGIATIFTGEPAETKILKVSAGFSEDDSLFFNNDYQEDNIHIFTGKFKWLDGLDLKLDDVIYELIDILLNNKTIKKALEILKISETDFKIYIHNKIYKFEGKSVEDNVREIFELSAIVVYNEKMRLKKTNFLIIKDGTLFPSSKTVSSLFSEAIDQYFNNEENYIIGVVKSSRFVNRENSWSNAIHEYALNIPSHSFFRIPDNLELSIDKRSKEHSYRRYFLSLYGGESIFEIQISRKLSDNKDKLEFVLNVLKTQITSKYGGSIITNSYAHEKASIPESEANFLTKEIKNNINKDLK